ncbi:F0F1 ATP synthase subunit delta [Zavarzinia sp.]|uniref:F0F1 ATP synthase subunit delta n=1 Tax=Zavarzinia sp. TaxID=2027920 RepID=UPI003564BD90
MATSSSIVAQIGGRYAGALFDLSKERGVLDAVAGDLNTIAALIAESADLAAFLRSPLRKPAELVRGMKALLSAAGIGPFATHFTLLLAKNGRLFALPAAIGIYRELLAKERGEVTAHVVSAEPLSFEQDQQLKAELSRLVGKTVMIDAKVDQSLLGGLVVRVGSRQIDGSLKTKLDRLAVAMKGNA